MLSTANIYLNNHIWYYSSFCIIFIMRCLIIFWVASLNINWFFTLGIRLCIDKYKLLKVTSFSSTIDVYIISGKSFVLNTRWKHKFWLPFQKFCKIQRYLQDINKFLFYLCYHHYGYLLTSFVEVYLQFEVVSQQFSQQLEYHFRYYYQNQIIN